VVEVLKLITLLSFYMLLHNSSIYKIIKFNFLSLIFKCNFLAYKSVDREYKKLIKDYANTTDIAPMRAVPPNVVNISSIPWIYFEHFSSHQGAIKNNLTPMITSGKYEKVGSQLLMPVNIKVHHATVDGYHVSLFFLLQTSQIVEGNMC